MPELPEVETIRRGLAKRILGHRIDGVDFRPQKRLRSASARPLAELEGQTVKAVDRHGKFLLLRLRGGDTLLVHLGMTGKLLFAQSGEPEKPHTHFVLQFDDETELRFSDPRRFGAVKLHGKGPVPDLASYGIDALDPSFTAEGLGAMLAKSSAPLKAFLLDQRKVAGIGNIYAAEALWRAGLSPRRKARTTPKAKIPLLRDSIVAVLQDSLLHGGTSFNDYVNAIGESGQYMAELAVFQREGEECPRCGGRIRRITQSGRSTFFCPMCQK